MSSRKLVVEVCSAKNLMPKDGQGSSSAYVQVDYDGQRRRTTTRAKDLNPVWNEKFEFLVSDPSDMASEALEANIYNEIKAAKRSSFLGRARLNGSSFVKKGEETLCFFPLEKRGIFSHIKGEIGLKVYYIDEVQKPPEADQKKAEEKRTENTPAVAEVRAEPAPVAAIATSIQAAEPAPASAEAAKPSDQPPPAEEKPAESTADPPAAAPPSKEKKETKADDSKTEKKKEKAPKLKVNESKPSSPSAPVVEVDYLLRDTNPYLGAIHGEKLITYDLVEKMQYLFVRVVKARGLAAKDVTGSSDPYVRLTVGSHTARTRTIPKDLNPQWTEVFAFAKDRLQAPALEVMVWDEDVGKKDDFLGAVSFDLQEIPSRVPPDSPLAPQWYRLEETRDEGRVKGDIMLAVWLGTQADEAFPEAWQSDTGGHGHTRSKVYLSPKLWYLRVNVIEAQDLQLNEKARFPEVFVKAELGFQLFRTRVARNRTNSPFWNEDLIFVAAEPFDENLILWVEDQLALNNKDHEAIGQARISLASVEKRMDDRQVASRWFNLDKGQGDESNAFRGRIHLRICLDGGYHVMDEAAHLSSDLKPTAKQLWKSALGVLEVGILGGRSLLPMKTKDGRGSTDAYCVAKYGQKWVRTRTILDSFNPRWNEQYTWDVYDPCTVLTVGVFDNCHLQNNIAEKAQGVKDVRIGKVRVRVSTLESNRVYTNLYPLLVLHPTGAKKMGEVELAVRFSSFSFLNVMHIYTQPMLPSMHYKYPVGITQQDNLRHIAMKMVALRLARSEPPLRHEVVQYMLDTDSNVWSMRRSKANWYRIMSVLGGVVGVARWVDDVCLWKNPVTTLLVHTLFFILVCYPELILPTAFLYMFLIGNWNYRLRPKTPPHMDARISHADAVDADELEEEFDTVPSSKPAEVIRMRYERLRGLAGRIQTVLGDVATQGERIQALLSWRDPRATSIFVLFSFFVAVILYVTPTRVIALLAGLYFLRHPRFRHALPPTPLNFFRRLPALSDRIL